MQNNSFLRRVLGATLLPVAALAFAAAPGAAAVPAARDGIRLHADVSQRTLTVRQGDEVVRSYAIAVGTQRYPTPRGSFSIRKIVWNPGWVPPKSRWARNKTAKEPGERGNPMKVVKMFFREPTYYIHGTGDTESLGSAASHGCLRMDPGEAAELAQYLMDHGGAPRSESWFRRVLRFRTETEVVYLDNPISLHISG